MYRIRRFGIVKTATVVAVIYLVVIAIFFAIALLAVAVSPQTWPGATVANVAVGGLIVAVIYAFFGWIFTAIACAIYNLAAGWVGGIEVQVEAVAPPPAAPSWGPTYASNPPPPSPAEPPTAPPAPTTDQS